jgi:hypothetical protein
MRSLRIAVTVLAVVGGLWIAPLADAGVGDYRLVTGTIAWPLAVGGERTLVIHGDDGVMRFAELAPGESFRQLRAGDRVSVLGREGFKSDQLLFAQIERREDANDTSAPAALPTAVATTASGSDNIRESPDVVFGIVDSVQGRTLAVATPRGQRVQVDIAAIDADIRRDLRPGDQVTVFAPNRSSGMPVATGIMVDHSSAPAASPR